MALEAAALLSLFRYDVVSEVSPRSRRGSSSFGFLAVGLPYLFGSKPGMLIELFDLVDRTFEFFEEMDFGRSSFMGPSTEESSSGAFDCLCNAGFEEGVILV